MRVVCSFCRKEMGTKPPLRDGSVTHGMCPGCSEHFSAQWSGMSWDQYLERFTFPVLMVEGDVRLVALNRPASAMLGRPPEELVGLLGGEALECSHSRLPEGCGRTVHCSTCTIRNTVTATQRTGKPQLRVPATLRRKEGSKALLVSTSLEGKLVRVTLEPQPTGDPA
jgi:PAS domain-containing protein